MTSNTRKSKGKAAAMTTAALLIAAVGTGSIWTDSHRAEATAPAAQESISTSNHAFAGSIGQPVIPSTARQYAAAPAAPKAEANEPLHIVAVGDSLTVGYENGMTVSSIPYGYVERVYEQALYRGRADLKNYGIIALKTPGLNKFLKAAADGTRIAADEVQTNLATYPLASETVAKTAALAADLKNADLVTLTIGGNDFTPIFDDIKSNSLSAADLQAKMDAMLADYVPQLEASLRTILGLNPKATVVFADQYLPVPKPSVLNKAITQEQYDILSAAVTKLKGLDEALADKLTQEGYDVRTVDVSVPFKNNELVYTYILKGDIHPKQSGYDVMGRAFSKGIWGDYRDPAALPAGAPLRVVVNGTDLKGNHPVLKNNTTFLPMRDVANALHATLNWDNKTRTATIASGGKKVAFTIGANTMKVNGQSVALETPAYLQQSNGSSLTYLPLAALSKGLGYQVDYRKPIATVYVNS
ncbi:stalk domain-containing protein [Paenibacillus sacheonensis]|uniref:Copper amine oxidase n=1 Tax=Paenibacillus sacheonensis TaxID=742054 RepID=A0A7X4YP18_9BACL|nr:stalk domain-containing protein [Paenibacillus sacheonensis]MBM7567305.1 lysophospholipase L1-like esterase [Paenibacillus sacheonensis]NBC69911.1 copper amine oxidase [Paenibacillus sacheonensis]